MLGMDASHADRVVSTSDATRLLREVHAILGDADDLFADQYHASAPIRTTLADVRRRLGKMLRGGTEEVQAAQRWASVRTAFIAAAPTCHALMATSSRS